MLLHAYVMLISDRYGTSFGAASSRYFLFMGFVHPKIPDIPSPTESWWGVFFGRLELMF